MSREMMVRLASTYFGEGMYVESSATYHRLQDVLPEDNDRCEWQHRVVINALATDDKTIQWKETQGLGKEWVRMRDAKRPKAVRKQCRDNTRDTLQRMATVWHEEGDKTRRLEAFEMADRAYSEFLTLFPRGKTAYEIASTGMASCCGSTPRCSTAAVSAPRKNRGSPSSRPPTMLSCVLWT